MQTFSPAKELMLQEYLWSLQPPSASKASGSLTLLAQTVSLTIVTLTNANWAMPCPDNLKHHSYF